MKYFFAAILSCLFLLIACEEKRDTPNTDIEVARAFIKDILENNFKEASNYVSPGETNEQYFSRFKKFFESKSPEELKQYKEADIVINEIENVSDSVTVVNYSNSFKKTDTNKVKVVKINGRWMIDFDNFQPPKK